MKYNQLGNSGVRVSAIGLGTNQFGGVVDQDGVNNIIAAAEDLGINFIDTANAYAGTRSETTLGNALKGRWDKFVVATKVYFPMGDGPNERGTSRYHIMNAVEDSLRRLQSDHIDLYQMHRWDETTPIAEETLLKGVEGEDEAEGEAEAVPVQAGQMVHGIAKAEEAAGLGDRKEVVVL